MCFNLIYAHGLFARVVLIHQQSSCAAPHSLNDLLVKCVSALLIDLCHFLLTVNGKSVPLQAWTGPEVSRKLRFPDYMTKAQDDGKVVSLTHRPFLPPGITLVLIPVRGWVDPRAIARSEGLCQWEIPMTPSGIERATFRSVAQYLNQCATAVPKHY